MSIWLGNNCIHNYKINISKYDNYIIIMYIILCILVINYINITILINILIIVLNIWLGNNRIQNYKINISEYDNYIIIMYII